MKSRNESYFPIQVALALCLSTSSIVMITGCHRSYFRREADAEAQWLIRQKLNDPRWNQLDPSIDTRVESRMHDPFSVDHPPMPPDDSASNKLMRCVDQKPGYQHWDVNGNTTYVENPDWRSYLPLNKEGVLELDLQKSVELALIHSDDLQTERETLYLSALDVSLERFGFDTQGIYGFTSLLETQDRLAPGGTNSSLTLTDGPAGLTRIEKLGINGASLVVGIANTVIWNFTGDNSQAATSLIDFSLIQPLLQGAGRQVILESLTQAERTLLANVRQLERFRRGFYLNIVTGRAPGAGPNLAGAFLAEPVPGIAGAGGFLGLLQAQQQIQINEFNVQSLRQTLEQFREFNDKERLPLLQVKQAEQTLYQAQETLVNLKVDYQESLDDFKRSLGLPPQIDVVVKDPFLNQFELISPELLGRRTEVDGLRVSIGDALEKISPFLEGAVDSYDWSPEFAEAVSELSEIVELFVPYLDGLEGDDGQLVEEDIEDLEKVVDSRKESLKKLQEFLESGKVDYEIEEKVLDPEAVESPENLRNLLAIVKSKGATLREAVTNVKNSIDEMVAKGDALDGRILKKRIDDEILYEIPELQSKLADALIELTLLQARARANSVALPEVDLESDKAIAIASQFRRDLMNARASLVDQWRLIELAADDLESTLDIEVNGSVGNTGNNPFNINWNTNQFSLGLSFDAPIARVAERNAYRSILIDYQQARRAFYNFEDAIAETLRDTLRLIQQNKIIFELNRLQITSAIEQVELAQLNLREPVEPGAGRTTLGPTAANDLTNALSDLQVAQSGFLDVWVTFEVLRRNLDFDLGTMQLSPDGYWRDPGTINEMYAQRAAEALGIPADQVSVPPGITINEEFFEAEEPNQASDSPSLGSGTNEGEYYQPREDSKPQEGGDDVLGDVDQLGKEKPRGLLAPIFGLGSPGSSSRNSSRR